MLEIVRPFNWDDKNLTEKYQWLLGYRAGVEAAMLTDGLELLQGLGGLLDEALEENANA